MKSFLKSTLAIAALIIGLTNLHAHSDAFKPEFVDTLLQPYLAIQKALAEDKLPESRTGARNLLKAVKKGPSETDAPEITKFSKPAEKIIASKNIADARDGFLSLSKEMQSLIEHVGTTGKSDLFLIHCPMAFDNRGASWIQGDQKVANPYYGARMLRCGDVKKQPTKGAQKTEIKTQPSAKAELIPATAELINAQAPTYPDTCMVSDEPLVEGEILDFSYRGELVRFCCKGCRRDFMDDPEGYMEKLQALKASPAAPHQNEAGQNHQNHNH